MPLGKIEEFDGLTQNISRYLERLEQYFEANEVPEDDEDSQRRRAILLSVLGAKTYDTLSDLCSPETPANKSYDELKEVLKSHFAPKKLIVTERFRFHNCKQEESQTASEFSASLKRLASTCEFGEFLPQALQDGFVCGLKNTTIQEKLLAEDYSFQDALKIAINMETAVKDIAEVNPKLWRAKTDKNTYT